MFSVLRDMIGGAMDRSGLLFGWLCDLSMQTLLIVLGLGSILVFVGLFPCIIGARGMFDTVPHWPLGAVISLLFLGAIGYRLNGGESN